MTNQADIPILQQMAEALLARRALELRELTQMWWRRMPDPSNWDEPTGTPSDLHIAAAALAELLAEQANMSAPQWARNAGQLAHPFFALAAASRMASVRELCERESPAPLLRHGILAPPNFLQLA